MIQLLKNFEREPLNKMYNQIFKRPFDEHLLYFYNFNRYRRKRAKVDASIFDSALSHTHRSDASERREENSVSTFGRFRLWTSLESSPVSVKSLKIKKN